MNEFHHCMAGTEAADAVSRDSAAAARLQIEGTPTFLVNDIEIGGYDGPETFDRVLAKALSNRTP